MLILQASIDSGNLTGISCLAKLLQKTDCKSNQKNYFKQAN